MATVVTWGVGDDLWLRTVMGRLRLVKETRDSLSVLLTQKVVGDMKVLGCTHGSLPTLCCDLFFFFLFWWGR